MVPDPVNSRIRTVYVLIGLNIVMLFVLVGALVYVTGLRDDVDHALEQTRAACARGNLVRTAVNYNGTVTQSFLLQAATTRDRSADEFAKNGDSASETINRDAANAYRSLAAPFERLALVDCEALFP